MNLAPNACKSVLTHRPLMDSLLNYANQKGANAFAPFKIVMLYIVESQCRIQDIEIKVLLKLLKINTETDIFLFIIV